MASSGIGSEPIPLVQVPTWQRLTIHRDWGLWVFTGVIGLLVLLPVLMLVLGSLSEASVPSDFDFSNLTLENFAKAYTSPLTYRVAGNTAIYMSLSLFFGMAIALLFAWLVARTNMPAKWLAYVGLPIALAMPGMLDSMAWVLLFSPRIGFVNRFLMGTLGLSSAPIDVYTMAGMVSLESLRLVPTSFLMLLPLMLRFDPSLEEAAVISGGRAWTIARRVTLPVLMPGLLSVAIYHAMTVLSTFEVPGIIGLPAHVYVFSTLIYTYSAGATVGVGSSYGLANALAMAYLALNVAGIWLYGRFVKNADRFAIVRGRGYRPQQIDLGRWRWPAVGVLCAFLFVLLVLPTLVLIWTSLTPRILQPSGASLAQVTGNNWRQVFASPEIIRVLLNTGVATLATASLTCVVCLIVSWIVIRTNFKGKALLAQLSFVSHGIPGIIMALALIWLWVRITFIPIYGTLWIIVLGFTVGFLAFGTRTLSAGLLQIHSELSEAAYLSGASARATIRRVFAPLLLPGLAGLWIWAALQATRLVSLPLMLTTGRQNTILSAYLWDQWTNGNPNVASALGVFMVTLLLVLTLVASRFGLGSRQASLA